MNTYIYLTTQTSATDSMLRIFCTLRNEDFVEAKFIDHFLEKNHVKDLCKTQLPSDGKIHRFNLPPYFYLENTNEKHKFLINFRDPRDRLCNVYHWKFSHQVVGESEEDRQVRLKKLSQTSIDDFVLENADDLYFKNLIHTLEDLDESKFVVLSYARLCLDFDSFLVKAAEFLNVELTEEKIKSLDVERIENLSNNKNYIGNKWVGSDTQPGRYRRELKEETIDILNNKFDSILRKMAIFDNDYADLYLEGLK